MTDAAAPPVETPTSATAPPETMAWDSRARRMVVLWLPLACFLIILLFPFYWMTITAFKPDAELYNFAEHNPLWISSPTLDHVYLLLFKTSYPKWLKTTMMVAIGATFLSLFASTLAAYAIQRLRFTGSQYVGLAIYLAYLVPPSILFIPLATMVVQLGLFDSPLALILVYPTFLVPFCTWLLIGYFKSIPYELEECALIDGATRLQILRRITLPLAVPGLISAGIFSFTLSWNEFIYAREQDRAGRHPDGAGDRRRLPVGSADGGIAARLAAGRDLLFILRRLLRLVPHGRGEGIAAAWARRKLRSSTQRAPTLHSSHVPSSRLLVPICRGGRSISRSTSPTLSC